MDINVVLKIPCRPLAGAAGGAPQEIATQQVYECMKEAETKTTILTL